MFSLKVYSIYGKLYIYQKSRIHHTAHSYMHGAHQNLYMTRLDLCLTRMQIHDNDTAMIYYCSFYDDSNFYCIILMQKS